MSSDLVEIRQQLNPNISNYGDTLNMNIILDTVHCLEFSFKHKCFRIWVFSVLAFCAVMPRSLTESSGLLSCPTNRGSKFLLNIYYIMWGLAPPQNAEHAGLVVTPQNLYSESTHFKHCPGHWLYY
jgi:hypothetical protein